jgi:hypothetical protein
VFWRRENGGIRIRLADKFVGGGTTIPLGRLYQWKDERAMNFSDAWV